MKKLKKSFCLLLVILFSIFIAPLNLKNTSAKTLIRTNKYPIVLVHGLFGWGNDEFFGLNYWGGKNSIKKYWKPRVTKFILHQLALYQATGIEHVSYTLTLLEEPLTMDKLTHLKLVITDMEKHTKEF